MEARGSNRVAKDDLVEDVSGFGDERLLSDTESAEDQIEDVVGCRGPRDFVESAQGAV